VDEREPIAVTPTTVPRLNVDPAALPAWGLRPVNPGTRARHEEADRWLSDPELYARRELGARVRDR